MDEVLLWVLICATTAILMIWGFVRSNHKLKAAHRQRVGSLETLQMEQLDQMRLRATHLDRYRFPERNLTEALIPQPAISI